MTISVDEVITDVEVTPGAKPERPQHKPTPLSPSALRRLEEQRRRCEARTRGWGFDD